MVAGRNIASCLRARDTLASPSAPHSLTPLIPLTGTRRATQPCSHIHTHTHSHHSLATHAHGRECAKGIPVFFFLTGDFRDRQAFLALLGEKRKMNFCAICALEMRFVALDSSSLVMDFRTKQRSKPTCRTPSVRREVSALG